MKIKRKTKGEKEIRKIINTDIAGQLKEDQVMMLDLLTLLTYMSAISTSDISRAKLFEFSGQQEGITAKALRKIHLLAKNYGYDFATACKLVAEEVRHPDLKSFLIRFSNALGTGEEEEKFLRGEMGDTVTMSILSGLLVCFVALFGVYVLFKSAPYEVLVHSMEMKSKEQGLAEKMCKVILPILGIAAVTLLVMGVETWIIFLVVAALLAPIGVVGMIDGKKIEERDMDLSPILNSMVLIINIATTSITETSSAAYPSVHFFSVSTSL